MFTSHKEEPEFELHSHFQMQLPDAVQSDMWKMMANVLHSNGRRKLSFRILDLGLARPSCGGHFVSELLRGETFSLLVFMLLYK